MTGTSRALGAAYWKKMAGRAPHESGAWVRPLLACPDDDAPLDFRVATGDFSCPACTRSFTMSDGILSALPTRDGYLLKPAERAALEQAATANPPADTDPAAHFGPLWGAVMERLGNLKGRTVLDVCCGTGFIARALAEAGARVVALDIVAGPGGLADLAAARTADMELELVQGDVCRLPLAADAFDVVIGGGALHTLRRPERLAMEIGRVLRREGGVFVALGEPVGSASPSGLRAVADYTGLLREGMLETEVIVEGMGPAPARGMVARAAHALRASLATGRRAFVARHPRGVDLEPLRRLLRRDGGEG
jgi:SAM-dependent methyltransferase